jgi:hypothetical protein
MKQRRRYGAGEIFYGIYSFPGVLKIGLYNTAVTRDVRHRRLIAIEFDVDIPEMGEIQVPPVSEFEKTGRSDGCTASACRQYVRRTEAVRVANINAALHPDNSHSLNNHHRSSLCPIFSPPNRYVSSPSLFIIGSAARFRPTPSRSRQESSS